jgi:hypothetical protein
LVLVFPNTVFVFSKYVFAFSEHIVVVTFRIALTSYFFGHMATPATKRQPEGKARVQPLLFEALEADGSNYLEWSIDARSYLCAEELDSSLAATPPLQSQRHQHGRHC